MLVAYKQIKNVHGACPDVFDCADCFPLSVHDIVLVDCHTKEEINDNPFVWS